MKRLIIDFKKLTPDILRLLTDKYPDGYGDDDIITFENHRNEIIEALEVKTEDSIYLVKIHSQLHYSMANFEDDLEIKEVDDVDIDETDFDE
ncbi:MAG: hypothetical protein HKO92_12240 [Flavobacteriaceae bacterium]|nr:hypothetical protein [Bacteroidia bacterium]NNK83885.1 hypothetical protein [Flavobacteriaceae bacterium]